MSEGATGEGGAPGRPGGERSQQGNDARATLRDLMPGVRADLEALVRIPSVSADPARAQDVRRSAEETARLCREAGALHVAVLDDIEGGQPAVLARWPAPPGAPTVLLYAHHDVQPTGDLAAWSSPPFEPQERDGRLYGRGTADDKAGIAAHLAALRVFGGRPPVGVTLFVEGEEELGSPTLSAFIQRYRQELAADAIVLADSLNFDVGIPALTTGLRGLTDCVVEVATLEHGVHSGVYGGPAPDALTSLCRLLATLHDDLGDVAVKNLGRAPDPQVDYPAERFRAEASMLSGVHLTGTGSIAERLWAKPAVSVLAIDATAVADVSNTLAPSARAVVSLRLPPGLDAVGAQRMLMDHLRGNAPWGVHVEVTAGATARPYAIDVQGPVYDAARRAYREAYGRDLVSIGMGGSIPFVADFAEAFPAAAILTVSAGADPDSREHGTDESLHLGDFEKACLAETLLLTELAALDLT
ncbi:MAG TPA: dipeptidase [Streptosporangiaceae bacterium]|nr:dipeptidase [Streptosporangiaceae bacterium]